MFKKIFICKKCGKKYTSYKENSKFCSNECKKNYNHVEYNCDFCREKFITNRYKIEDLKKGKHKHLYCSRECANKAQYTSVTKICEYCNKEYVIINSFSDIQKYCSMECYNNARSQMVKLQHKICPMCNKKFDTYHNEQIYCSRKCSDISNRKRVTCICEYCGKTFDRIVSEVNKNKRHYCSNECRYEGIRWSVSDIAILRENYRKIKTTEIQKMLSKHYSIKAIRARAKDYGFSKSRLWSKEEEEIILNNYDKVPLNQMMKLLPDRTLSSIMHKARQYNLLSKFYINNVYKSEEIKFLRDNYLSMSNKELASHLNRSEGAIAQKLLNLSLYRPTEIKKDGYKDLINFMRSRLATWKEEVRKEYNYTCCLSGKKSNLVVHHCHSFNLLFDETVEILNFPILDNFIEYEDDQLILFVETFLNLQEYYGQYVCISEDIHKLFHDNYGYGDNTIEQWDDFTEKYKNNYYNNVA